MFCVLRKSLIVLCLVFTSIGQADSNFNFNRLFVLGDSLSDMGNLASTGQIPFLAGPPYEQGRFTNGPVAVELLAQSLGLELKPSLHLVQQFSGTNFAVAGAKAGGQDPIDLATQLGALLATNPGGFAPNDLFILMFGGNDIRGTRTIASNRASFPVLLEAAEKVAQAAALLLNAGARNIMVVNAPDIGLIPETDLVTRLDTSLSRRLTARSKVFNFYLIRAVLRLRRQTDAHIVPVDLFGFLANLTTNGKDLGYNNVTDACFVQTGILSSDQIQNPQCDFDRFLFFDAIHPSAITHQRAAKFLESVVPNPDA